MVYPVIEGILACVKQTWLPTFTYNCLSQAQGRGRAEDSSYTLVEVKNSGVAEKECVNEYRKKMMNKAIQKIKSLNQAAYEKRVRLLQNF